MVLKDFFLAQLEREAASTRKGIERVPMATTASNRMNAPLELGYLAALVACMLGWIAFMIDRDELNLDAAESEGFRTKPLAGKADLLASLDTAVANARRALQCTTDQHLAMLWAFKMGGRTVSEHPRSIMISDAVFSHLAHHRGQLTVYLRLVDSKVPALYGPSADEYL
jgi:uncharacterized damage-inducible protein DinB